MTLIDHLPTVNLRPRARATASPAAARVADRPAAARAADSSAADLAAADALIADLAALVDAGLVTARRQLGGPVRYGPVVDLSDAA